MPRYLIERSFKGRVEIAVEEFVERNADDGVTWLCSYVSGERRKAFDVYEAPSPEAIRRAAGRNRLPIDVITEVRVLDPYSYEEAKGEAMSQNGYAKAVLVTTEWLAEHLNDDGLVVAEADENTDLYEEGHIPGAVKLHWREDLQDPVERDIVDGETFERVLGERGIANDTAVILYGDKNNWFAAYAYWYLKVYGHADVRILDGGRQKWIDEGRELTTEVPSPAAKAYSASARDESIRAYRDQVLAWLGAAGRALVDVRSPAEYSGELIAPPGYEQEGAQRAGHIPTAVSIPWASAVQDDGTFKPAAALEDLYGGQGVSRDKEVTAYCRIGERSAHTWFVLRELLGYDQVRNYDGSWTEWGNLVDVPIERGVGA